MATVQEVVNDLVNRQDAVFNTLQDLVSSVRDTADQELNVNFPEFQTLSFWDPYVQMQAAEQKLLGLVDSAPAGAFTEPAIPADPATPTIEGTARLAAVTIPTFSKTPPNLAFPAKPSITTPTAPGAAPEIVSPTLPESPSYQLPAAPSLRDIVLPQAPSVAFPTFAGSAPAFNLAPPSNTFAFQEVPYDSALLDQITVDLLGDLQNGGYGINPNDEAGVWARAREREEAKANADEEALRSDYAGRGYNLPPGALMGALQGLRQNLRESVNALSREVALKRYDQTFEARKFALSLGFQVESALITYHGQVMERSLQFARSVAEIAISVYNASLATFNAKLDAYKTEASAFETLLRAEVEKVNVYRAQLEGARLVGEIDRNAVTLYTAQLQGIDTIVKIFSERMTAAKITSEIEQLKIQGFRAKVDAYVAQINAGESQVKLYEAEVRGQVAVAEAFRSEVQAYEAQVRGKETEVRAIAEQVRASVEVARSTLDTYRARLDAYRARVNTEGTKLDAAARNYQAKSSAVSAYASTMKEIGNAYVVNNRENNQQRFKRLDSQVEKAKLDYHQRFQNRGVKLEVGKWETELWKEIAGSALSSLDAVVAQVKEE